ncbi:MAG: type I restriction endonuclease subunit M [Deltaproteobacteria bacterium]|nr:type I restriction endonuclease subunit M [Deltaproteobacteria bacterium]
MTTASKKALFPLGQVVSTPGALGACRTDYLEQCLYRHMHGDWGNVCKEDAATNTEAVSAGFRIMSAYPIDPGKPCKGFGENTLWIITEADRSATTFLLPDEY